MAVCILVHFRGSTRKGDECRVSGCGGGAITSCLPVEVHLKLPREAYSACLLRQRDRAVGALPVSCSHISIMTAVSPLRPEVHYSLATPLGLWSRYRPWANTPHLLSATRSTQGLGGAGQPQPTSPLTSYSSVWVTGA